MEIVRGVKEIGDKQRSCVLTIGNFDGMHMGHRELVRRVLSRSKAEGIQGGLMTFDPHPLKVLAPEKQTKIIFGLDERILQAEQLGVDFFIIEPFSRELSELAPKDFFKRLLGSLRLRALVVGHDFTFGRNREGSHSMLTKLCEAHSIDLEIVPPVEIAGEIVSSTKIREAVLAADLRKAQLFLGQFYFMKGVVEKGAGRGKKIGFPTANLFTTGELFPKNGVYVTLIQINNKTYKSVTNVGINPTFEQQNRRPIQVETHILDFDQDIYGEEVVVRFLDHLRAEQKFPSVKDLTEQISKDIERVRSFDWPKK
jgi:riboflavin kinase/FMN adenylyltransferase